MAIKNTKKMSAKAQALLDELSPADKKLLHKDNPFRHERNALILELHARGVSTVVLGEVAGISQTAICNKIKKSVNYWRFEAVPVLGVDFHPVLMVFFSDTMREKYSSTLNSIRKIPPPYRQAATDRFLLIKIYEDIFIRANKQIFKKKFREKQVAIDYCRFIHVPISTFYRWLHSYMKLGIEGLVPRYVDPESCRIEDVVVRKDPVPHKGRIKTIIEIDPNNPFKCVTQLADFIKMSEQITQKKKDPMLKFLDSFVSVSNRKYFIPKYIQLKQEDIPLLQRYKARNHKRYSTRATALLMVSKGYCLYDIMVHTGASISSILRWIREYKKNGIGFIETTVMPQKREKMWEERSTRVLDILHTPPKNYGINRTSWVYDAIIQAYLNLYDEKLSKSSLKRIIKETGYTWRHARQVLTSPDPNYQKKVKKVLDVLRATKENEAFFFVDELGPYAVKKYGGKALVDKTTTRTVPSKQKSKGSVQAVAALEAFTNQLTWKFIGGKDVSAIFSIFEMLREKYSTKKKLIITWDTLSTHNAKEVKSWVKNNNNTVKRQNAGPAFKIVPLPSRSQFLNVIESVFRGMKTAVIHNSDYSSKLEMEAAIERHFKERNIYFKKNPKRVGNKIWDKEAFDPDKLRGGLFKKM